MVQKEMSQQLLDGLTCNLVKTFVVLVNFGDPSTFYPVPSSKHTFRMSSTLVYISDSPYSEHYSLIELMALL